MDNKVIDEFSQNLVQINQVERQIAEKVKAHQAKLKDLKKKDAELRQAVMEAMEKHDVKKFENDLVAITYVAPSRRMGVDVARLKEEAPETYKKYLKVSPIKASIRLKIKEED